MTDKTDALRLAELLCARLCHDLAGPIGTLIGALEVVREQQPGSEEAALAEEAAGEVAQRLKLLRAAWSETSEELDRAGLASLAGGLLTARKLDLVLEGLDHGIVFPPDAARIVRNLLLLGIESTPGGGTMILSSAGRGSIVFAIEGPRAAWPVGLASWLADDEIAWKALLSGIRTVQGPLTALLARDTGFRLSIMMPAGAGDEGDACPPLLLHLGQG